jgi:hypothetical protein
VREGVVWGGVLKISLSGDVDFFLSALEGTGIAVSVKDIKKMFAIVDLGLNFLTSDVAKEVESAIESLHHSQRKQHASQQRQKEDNQGDSMVRSSIF